MEGNKSDIAVTAGLMMAKQELEQKTGVSKSPEKAKGNQEKFLKDLKKKKKVNLEIDYDIFALNRVEKYPENIMAKEVLAVAKQKLWEKPKSIELINIVLVAEMKLGNLEKAEMNYKKAMNIDKNSIDVQYNGAVLKMREGKLDEALSEIKFLIIKKEETDFFYLMAMIMVLENRFEEAINILGKVLKSESNFEKSYNFFVLLSLLKENTAKSHEILEKLTENRGSIGNKITIECLKVTEGFGMDQKLIEQMVEESEFNSPEYSPCLKVSEGKVYFENGNISKAERSFDEAIDKFTACSCAYFEKMKIYQKRSLYEEAFEIGLKGLKIDSDFKPILSKMVECAYFLKNEKDANSFANAIYSLDNNTIVEIYNEDESLLKCKIDVLMDNFILKLNILMDKYIKEMPQFRIKEGSIMSIYKNFKIYDLCGSKSRVK